MAQNASYGGEEILTSIRNAYSILDEKYGMIPEDNFLLIVEDTIYDLANYEENGNIDDIISSLKEYGVYEQFDAISNIVLLKKGFSKNIALAAFEEMVRDLL